MGDIKLVYFPIRARAEPIRLAFAAAGKKYVNELIPFDKWPAEKANAPYGQLPYLVVNGKKYGECNALAAYVAKECGLAGKTNEDAMRVGEVFSLVQGLLESMAKVKFEKDEAKKAEAEKKLKEETIPNYLGFFERLLRDNGGSGFFVGSSLTLADLAVYDIVDTLLQRNPDILASSPEIKKMRSKVEGNAKIKAYLDSRPKTDI